MFIWLIRREGRKIEMKEKKVEWYN